jgi:predicted nucleotidyltransferase component of viral defense system
MIPRAYITAWRNNAPWQEDFQVEQDMVITRAILEIFGDSFLKERLAFRGGTALYKLHLHPAARYSEDIDLVQITAEPIGIILDHLRKRLSFLGKPLLKQNQYNNTLLYRFNSEDGIPLKLKIEINCREHHTIYGIQEVKFEMDSSWFNGEALISTYNLSELLGTKLRALYQRRKGRDLFDIWYALTQTKTEPEEILDAWMFYMKEEGHNITRKEFLDNMEKKILEKDFLNDMQDLLKPGLSYDINTAYGYIKTELLEKIKV